MSKPDQDSRVTLEDLLRLKRSERPNPDFWSGYEKELRQKQLTALVQKRRWWHEWSSLINRRAYLPAGAAAVVAFTLISVRYSAPVRSVPMGNSASEIAVTADPAIEMLAATEIAELDSVRQNSPEAPQTVAFSPAPAVATSDAAAVTANSVSSDQEAAVPATRSRLTNLARLEQTETDLLDTPFGSRLGEPARVQPASVVQTEVASMTTASASKYRLIARYVDRSLSPAPSAPAVVRERLARRLGDDLEDDISRIGVVGSRVSLKF